MHALLIVAFAGLMLHDQIGRAPFAGVVPGWVAALCVIVPLVQLAAFLWLYSLAAGRRLDRHGDVRAVDALDRMMFTARWLAVLVHLAGVLGLGWLEVVRDWMGDLVALDEIVASLPLIAFFLWCWWCAFAVERRLREAVFLRNVDEGRPLEPLVSRAGYVVMQARHHLLIVLVPMAFIIAWSETVVLLANNLVRRWQRGQVPWDTWPASLAEWIYRSPYSPLAATGVQFLGVVVVLLLLPLAIGVLWHVSPLPQGDLRDRLTRLCRLAPIRPGRLLIWRTRGTLVNGAVLGAAAPARCILLTDALLDHLPVHEVEAVMAHEIGHVRRRHLPWLMASMLVSAGLVGGLAEWALTSAGVLERIQPEGLTHTGLVVGLSAVSLIAGLLTLGYVSRRFEWQADAFAASILSRAETGPDAAVVTPAAAGAMMAALARVARLHHIDQTKFSWRHGSINTRLRRLHALPGAPIDRLPIDRTAQLLKLAIAVGGAATLALILWPAATPVS